MAVVPADSEAWRLLLEHLLDHASTPRLGRPLRLDDDQVSRLCRHCLPTSPTRLERITLAVTGLDALLERLAAQRIEHEPIETNSNGVRT